MHLIKISTFLTLLSVSSPRAHAEISNDINKAATQQDDVKNVVSTSSSLLRGAMNSAWHSILASDAHDKDGEDGVDVMSTLGCNGDNDSNCVGSSGRGSYCCCSNDDQCSSGNCSNGPTGMQCIGN